MWSIYLDTTDACTDVNYAATKTTDSFMEQKGSPRVYTTLENNAFCVNSCDFFAFDRNV